MPKSLSADAIAQYEREGYYFPVPVITAGEAKQARADVERAEAYFQARGERLRHRPHLLLTCLDLLVRHEKVLDAVEDLLGPNLLCWTSAFFTKEPGTGGYVSWHQDSTYWGLSTPDVLTAWIALSPSTVEAGAMRFIPGTHKMDQLEHRETFAEENLLTRGQEVEVEVDESQAVDLILQPGEMSLHHVRLIHGSDVNRSSDRRIGLAVRYIPTHVKQLLGRDFATLVRGVDAYGHFNLETPPVRDLDDAALEAYRISNESHNNVLYAGAAQMRG